MTDQTFDSWGNPIGPEVDATPRPIPARVPHRGALIDLEPLHPRHTADLWRAVQGDDAAWSWMGYGPFATEAALRARIEAFAAAHDPLAWAIRSHRSGAIEGWLTLMDIQPYNAEIELGHIWLGPRLRRTRGATEAMFILMRHAMDDLGYRRLVWKCNALNAASQNAAKRLGFSPEGVLRANLVIKGRRRDTAMFSILAEEWPSRRDAILAWLDEANIDHSGAPRDGLAAIRQRLVAAAA
ncbi:GNAT family N-acetyltransferase [Humitalea sp. 24SJ18S-53]|uniref:GNAT family N-acetyltransferase n=1 Tax=Humitalea sp. 24SJ18S-53 TaxID=3422307 RepID=UPI003D668060